MNRLKTINRDSFMNFFTDHIMMFVCVFMMVVGTVAAPGYLTASNIFSILRQMSIVAIVAVGQSIVIIQGGIDTSLSGMLSATVIFYGCVDHFPLPVAILLTVLFSALIGTFSGWIIAQFKVHSFIATMAVGTACEGIALLLSSGRTLFPKNNIEVFQTIATKNLLGVVPLLFLVAVVVIVIGQLILSKTTLGLQWRSIGGNMEAAYCSGINVKRTRIQAYTFCGAMVGIAALLTVGRTGVSDPVIGTGMHLDALSATVLGGTYMGGGGVGSVWGVIIGIFMLGTIKNLLALINVSSYWQYVVNGVIIIVAMIIGSNAIAIRARRKK